MRKLIEVDPACIHAKEASDKSPGTDTKCGNGHLKNREWDVRTVRTTHLKVQRQQRVAIRIQNELDYLMGGLNVTLSYVDKRIIN